MRKEAKIFQDPFSPGADGKETICRLKPTTIFMQQFKQKEESIE
jgi:hypothetical protein